MRWGKPGFVWGKASNECVPRGALLTTIGVSGIMLYRLSRHAQEQMAARNISSQSVDAVMQSPEQIVGGQNGKKCYQSRYKRGVSEFLLRLMVADDVTPAVVVTVYYTSQIDKYWV